MVDVTFRAARRPRSYVRVSGPDAEDLLQRLLSNDVSAPPCEALLLTPKARVIAPLVVWRRGSEDFLLLTEPELGETVRAHLLRARFRARCEVELEHHSSLVVFGGEGAVPNLDYGEPAVSADELERMRILAGTPRFGRELDDRVLPAEAGLVERAVSFTKGCYPGQEPVARLHYRGHANRGLRVLRLEGGELPEYDAELTWEGKAVGRVTSAALLDGAVVALGYVRTEVPADAELRAGARGARALHLALARP